MVNFPAFVDGDSAQRLHKPLLSSGRHVILGRVVMVMRMMLIMIVATMIMMLLVIMRCTLLALAIIHITLPP